MGKESNPLRFAADRDQIKMYGKSRGAVDMRTPEEIASTEEHDRQMKALYADKPEEEEED